MGKKGYFFYYYYFFLKKNQTRVESESDVGFETRIGVGVSDLGVRRKNPTSCRVGVGLYIEVVVVLNLSRPGQLFYQMNRTLTIKNFY